jgi:hypothetical protein
MTDPKRLLDDARAEPLRRSLLESARDPGPTDAQVDALWTQLVNRLPMAAPPAPPGAANALGGRVARAMGRDAVMKAVAVLAVTAAATAGIMASLPRSSRSAPVEAIRAGAGVSRVAGSVDTSGAPAPLAGPGMERQAAPAEASANTPAPQDALTGGALAAASPRAHVGGDHLPGDQLLAVRHDDLHGETDCVLRARRALRAGDCAGSLDALDEATRRFGAGALTEEREALTIESLQCAGRHAEAADRATAFLSAYPTSLHAAAMRRASGDR